MSLPLFKPGCGFTRVKMARDCAALWRDKLKLALCEPFHLENMTASFSVIFQKKNCKLERPKNLKVTHKPGARQMFVFHV